MCACTHVCTHTHMYAHTLEQRAFLPDLNQLKRLPPGPGLAKLPQDFCLSIKSQLRPGIRFKGKQKVSVIHIVCSRSEISEMVRLPALMLPAAIKPAKAHLCLFDVAADVHPLDDGRLHVTKGPEGRSWKRTCSPPWDQRVFPCRYQLLTVLVKVHTGYKAGYLLRVSTFITRTPGLPLGLHWTSLLGKNAAENKREKRWKPPRGNCLRASRAGTAASGSKTRVGVGEPHTLPAPGVWRGAEWGHKTGQHSFLPSHGTEVWGCQETRRREHLEKWGDQQATPILCSFDLNCAGQRANKPGG